MPPKRDPHDLEVELIALAALCNSYSAMFQATRALGGSEVGIINFVERWKWATVELHTRLQARLDAMTPTES